MFSTFPIAIDNTLPSLNPTTSVLHTSVPSLFTIVHTSPKETFGPIETITNPITSVTFPFIL
jgi:hypothetical protein